MKKTFLTLIVGITLLSSCNNDDDNSVNTIDVSALTFEKIGGFANGTGDEGYAEITAFDPTTSKLFVVNPKDTEISVWDISNPELPTVLTPITLTSTPNSVAVKNEMLAVAIENVNKQLTVKLSPIIRLHNSKYRRILPAHYQIWLRLVLMENTLLPLTKESLTTIIRLILKDR